jgi:putative hydrolase of HD superfamily
MSANEIKLFKFATELEKMKKLERFKGQCYWRDYPKLLRYESVADHTWRVGMLVMIFSDQLSKKLNLEKALKMVLIHDLPEIFAGDASPLGKDGTGKDSHAFSGIKAKKRHLEEKKAAAKIFKMLPADISKKYFNLWIEYDLQKNYEAKVVKSLDRIEALIQVLEYRKGHLFSGHLEFNISYALKGSEIDPAIAKFGIHIAEQMKKKYKKFKK